MFEIIGILLLIFYCFTSIGVRFWHIQNSTQKKKTTKL